MCSHPQKTPIEGAQGQGVAESNLLTPSLGAGVAAGGGSDLRGAWGQRVSRCRCVWVVGMGRVGRRRAKAGRVGVPEVLVRMLKSIPDAALP